MVIATIGSTKNRPPRMTMSKKESEVMETILAVTPVVIDCTPVVSEYRSGIGDCAEICSRSPVKICLFIFEVICDAFALRKYEIRRAMKAEISVFDIRKIDAAPASIAT
jgi:hypothetical protein